MAGTGHAATQVFNYTGTAQTFTVPAGITSIVWATGFAIDLDHLRSQITPATKVSEWSYNTLDQGRIQTRLMSLVVRITLSQGLAAAARDRITLRCTYTGETSELACENLVLVTARLPVKLKVVKLLPVIMGAASSSA